MAYDSKTYGQSPFGNPQPPDDNESSQPAVERGTDEKAADQPPAASTASGYSFPSISTIPAISTGQTANALDNQQTDADQAATGPSKSRPRSSSRSTATKAPRKSKRAKASKNSKAAGKTAAKTSAKASAKTAKETAAEPETAEEAIARRFLEEDRKTYLSLLYKTAISGLVWAVLRLVRHQVSERAIATINIIIHPVLVSSLALLGTIGLTFWLRYLLKDLALHTQQLSLDAEATDGKNYRPTLEIVGDSLEYNPKLRKQLSRLFDVASVLICTLISYVMTSLLLPWG